MSATTAARRRRKSKRTPQQRAAEAEALHATLLEQIEALTNNESWKRFLEFTASFHSYSLPNLMLILGQNPDATQVAGFRQWQARGRQVRAGERAIKIRGYSTKKITTEDPDTGDDIETKQPRFPILSVFDIAQTDPIDGAEQVEAPTQRLTGEDPHGIYAAVEAHLVAQDWSVEREPVAGGTTNGYTTTDGTRRVVVDADLGPAMAAKTLIHEAAHVTLHTAMDTEEYVQHRGIVEAEAESVAYVVAGLAGLDTSGYSVGYVATWTHGDLDAIRGTADNVLRAVRAIAPAVTGTEGDDNAP